MEIEPDILPPDEAVPQHIRFGYFEGRLAMVLSYPDGRINSVRTTEARYLPNVDVVQVDRVHRSQIGQYQPAQVPVPGSPGVLAEIYDSEVFGVLVLQARKNMKPWTLRKILRDTE